MITKFKLFESTFTQIRMFKPDTRNFRDNDGAELRKMYKMIYELEYKLHMMSILKYIGTQRRKKIIIETYEARLNYLLVTSLIMFRNLFDTWLNEHIYETDNPEIQDKVKEVEKLFDQLPGIRKTYERMPLNKKIILFHKCVNQTHVNGSMLKFIEDMYSLSFDFEEFLNELSNSERLQELWKSELNDLNWIELKPKI